MNTDVRSIANALKDEGYEIVHGGKHIRVEKDGVMLTTLPLTPSDRRWRKNKVSELLAKGMLKRDPKSNYTPKKEKTDMPQWDPLSVEEMTTLNLLVEDVVRHEGLKMRKGRAVPYGLVPVLKKALIEYERQVGFPLESLPRVVHGGNDLDWSNDLELICELGARRVSEMWNGKSTNPWPSTRAFIPMAYLAWEWWTTPAVAEPVMSERQEMLDESMIPVLGPPEESDLNPEGVPVETESVPLTLNIALNNLNGQRERVELAIEIAAQVGGHLGMDLAHRVLEVK